MEQNKTCRNDDDSNDVMKKEPQDLAGLLSSPDSKSTHEVNTNGVKSEPVSEVKEEIKEEIKTENVRTPGSVGKLPNGDANSGKFRLTEKEKLDDSCLGVHG